MARWEVRRGSQTNIILMVDMVSAGRWEIGDRIWEMGREKLKPYSSTDHKNRLLQHHPLLLSERPRVAIYAFYCREKGNVHITAASIQVYKYVSRAYCNGRVEFTNNVEFCTLELFGLAFSNLREDDRKSLILLRVSRSSFSERLVLIWREYVVTSKILAEPFRINKIKGIKGIKGKERNGLFARFV